MALSPSVPDVSLDSESQLTLGGGGQSPILHITEFGHLDSTRYETKIIVRLTLCLSLVSSFLSAKNKTQLNSLFEEDGLKIIQYEGET